MNISPGNLIPPVYLFDTELQPPLLRPRGRPLLDPLDTGFTLSDPIPNGLLYGLLLVFKPAGEKIKMFKNIFTFVHNVCTLISHTKRFFLFTLPSNNQQTNKTIFFFNLTKN